MTFFMFIYTKCVYVLGLGVMGGSLCRVLTLCPLLVSVDTNQKRYYIDPLQCAFIKVSQDESICLSRAVCLLFFFFTVLDLVYYLDGVVATSCLFFNCLGEDHPEDGV